MSAERTLPSTPAAASWDDLAAAGQARVVAAVGPRWAAAVDDAFPDARHVSGDIHFAESAGRDAFRPGSADLVVVDPEQLTPGTLWPLLARDGTVVVIAPDGALTVRSPSGRVRIIGYLDGSEQGVAEDGSRGKAARGALWLGLSAIAMKLSQTVVLLVLAALLDPEALGVLAVGALVTNVIGALADFGSGAALVYWRGDVERAARSALSIGLVTSVLLTALGWAVAPGVSALMHTGADATWVIRGLLLQIPFWAVLIVSRNLLARDLRFVRRVLPDIVGATVGTAVSLELAFSGYGVRSLVVGQVLQAALMALLFCLMRRPVLPGWNSADVRGLLTYGRGVAGASVSLFLLMNVDYLIVGHVLGPDQLGVYSLAFRLAFMPVVLGAATIVAAAFAYLCRLRRDAVGESSTELIALLGGLLVPVYLLMALLAQQIEILGDDWAPAVAPLRWLAAYGIVLCVVRALAAPYNAVGRPVLTLALTLIHLGLLTAALLLTARYGVTAVAATQALVVVVVAAIGLRALVREVPGVRLRTLAARLLPVAAGAGAMALVVLGVQRVPGMGGVSLTQAVVLALAGVVAYGATEVVVNRSGVGALVALVKER